MRDRKLDRLFDRYRRRGDVQALGELFDRTAPELLRVAMSLVREPGEADDLLQATYLTAIERAASYDAKRRLLPWLLGILVHHVHSLRRERAREVDAERLASPSPDLTAPPDRRAELDELSDVVVQALAELSERDRAVLDPFLREGKRAAEIARETGQAPGTVRMQIHRGLDRLRRLLPASMGLGAAATLLGGRGLAALRADVVAQGARTAVGLTAAGAVPVSTALLGGLAVKKISLAAGAAALVGGIAWMARPTSDSPSPATPPSAAPVELVESPVALEPAPAATRELPSAKDSGVESQTVLETSLYERALSGVRGRLVEHTGEPVPHLEVALIEVGRLALVPSLSRAIDGSSTEIEFIRARVTTDEEGYFSLGGARARSFHMLGIDLGGPRGALRLLDAGLEAGELRELGDVVLSPFATLRGRVVDTSGEPVAGARVRAARLQDKFLGTGLIAARADSAFVSGDGQTIIELPPWIARYEDELPFATGRTDERGEFTLERVALGGPKTRKVGIPFTLAIDCAGYADSVLGDILPTPDETLDVGSIEISEGVVLAGRVLDADGAPVAGAQVRVGPELEQRRQLAAVLGAVLTTDAQGAFEAPHLAPPGGGRTGSYAVAARSTAAHAWTVQSVSAEDAGAALEIRLPARAALTVRVVTADEEPIENAELWASSMFLLATAQAGLFAPERARARSLGSGEYALDGLSPGVYVVHARAQGYGLGQARASVSASGTSVRIVLPRSRPFEVQVVDASTYAALERAHVAVLRAGAVGAPSCEGETDRDGRVVLELPEALTRDTQYVLRAEHPGYAVRAEPLVPGALATTLELGPGAALRARVSDGNALPSEKVLLSLRYRDELSFAGLPQFALFDERGELSLSNLRPGEYRYSVGGQFLFDNPLESFGGKVNPQEFTSGRVVLRAGETAELEIQIGEVPAAQRRAALTGSVQLDGVPLAGAHVALAPYDGSPELEVATDGAGHFDFPDVPSGRLQLSIARDQGGEPVRMFSDSLDLAVGEAKHLALEWTTRVARVEVVRAGDGSPVANASVRLTARGRSNRGLWYYVRADENGIAEVATLAHGDYDVRVEHEEVGLENTRMHVAESATEAELRVEMTEGVPCAGRVSIRGVELPRSEHYEQPVFLLVEGFGEMRSTRLECEQGSSDFRIAGLRPGTYTAKIWVLDRESPTLPFELPESGDEQLALDFVFDQWIPSEGR